MEKTKSLKRYSLILYVISLLALLLPFVKTNVEVDLLSKSRSMIGLVTVAHSFFAFFLIAGPVLLIAARFIKPLKKYSDILAICVPIICIIALIIVRIQARNFCVPEMTKLGLALAKKADGVHTHLAFGGVVALISYIMEAVIAFRD